MPGRPSVAGLAVLGTLGGIGLLLRYDPATGAGTAMAGTVSSGTAALAARTAAASPGSGTPVLGRLVTTDFGHVQVEITVSGHRIVAARAVRTPEDGGQQGRRINGRALPILAAQAVRAQSAKIDGVSGATYSSNGYRQSLQSAIDAAHLA